MFRKRVDQGQRLCPECGHHFYATISQRIEQLLDAGSFEEWCAELASVDPLGFVDKKPYRERATADQRKTGLREACVVGGGYRRGRPVVIGLTDSAFIMGSMGSVVGEKFARAADRCVETGRPLIVITASGGARMQEGVIALMQMA
ncbi:MAG: carboxyl transferase domain-containing protein, partial [Maioricimonas sp. JB049]